MIATFEKAFKEIAVTNNLIPDGYQVVLGESTETQELPRVHIIANDTTQSGDFLPESGEASTDVAFVFFADIHDEDAQQQLADATNAVEKFILSGELNGVVIEQDDMSFLIHQCTGLNRQNENTERTIATGFSATIVYAYAFDT